MEFFPPMAAHQAIRYKHSWINNAFFEQILNNNGNSVRVVTFHLSPALSNGENFSSNLMRAVVEYITEGSSELSSKCFVIKAALDQLVRSCNVFAKEIHIYESIMPRIEDALKTVNISIKLTPKYYGGNVKQSYLMLEDLTANKYHNIPRSQGLNFDQLKRCLQTLVLWHAGSIKILTNTTSDQMYGLFIKPHVNPTGSLHYKTLFEHALFACSQAFERHPGFTDISFKLNRLMANVFTKCCAAAERHENGINVLTHGDLWSNNIMFHSDSDSDSLPIFLDFQMSYFGSPILDVSYLLFTSSNEDIKCYEFDQLFDYYCEQLIDTMRLLDVSSSSSKIPSKQQLRDEFTLRGCYGAMFSLFSVPLRVVDHSNNDAIKQFLNKSTDGLAYRTNIYSDTTVRKLLANLLLYFDKKQFLD